MTGSGSSCGGFFAAWQKRLEVEPDCWSIRSVVDGRVWRGPAIRDWLLMDEPIVSDKTDLMWIAREDRESVQSKHSTALKTGQPQDGTLTLQDSYGRTRVVAAVWTPVRCDGCSSRCGLILSVVAPLSDNSPATVPDPEIAIAR